MTRRRPATADETGSATPESSEPAGAPATTPAEPGGDSPVSAEAAPADEQVTQVLPATEAQAAVAAAAAQPAAAAEQPTVVGDQPTAAIEQPPPVRDLPAGIDPNELADAPIASARRGKLRRRLRYLRAVRDLLLRDLGGFTYEIERSAGGTAEDTQRRLIEAKTNRIATLDTEVRGLESRLGEPHGGALLREPGIGGTCPECGEIHASDAHYCARCGAPLDAKARARRDAAVAAVHQTTSSHAVTPEPAPASVLWAAGPRPEHKAEPDEDEDTQPSLATSQWLALRPHAAGEQGEEPAAKGDKSAATADEPAAKGDEPAAMGDDSAAKGDEPGARAGDPAAKRGEAATTGEPATANEAAKTAEPAAKGGEAATAGEPAEADEPAKAAEPVAKADEPGAAAADEAPLSERTALWLGAKPAEETEQADPPAPQTVAAKRAGARSRATGQRAAETPAPSEPRDAAEKPKRPRATRAKKPAAATGETAPATATDETAPATASGETAPATDETAPATASGETAPAAPSGETAPAEGEEAPAKPKRTRAKKPAPDFAPEPNGRRDDPVVPPQGDPLTSRPEQGS
ncbi:MAG TPA: hypothetical protein VFX51_21175 [Solirubrobacteraceae bacterium]|nr:hypothetical protein [Solirubrobacteraceae bacterium]